MSVQRERVAVNKNVPISQEGQPAPVSMAILSTQIRKRVTGVSVRENEQLSAGM